MPNEESHSQDFIDMLKQNGYIYESHRDQIRGRKAPLVGLGRKDGHGKNLVVEKYVNMPLLQGNRMLVQYAAGFLRENRRNVRSFGDSICACPEDAVFGKVLAKSLDKNFAMIKKSEKPDQPFVAEGMERAELVWIAMGIIYDTSNLRALIDCLRKKGVITLGFLAIINASSLYQNEFRDQSDRHFEIFSVANYPIKEYPENHPHILPEVASRNIVWDPMAHWQELLDSMEHRSLSE